MASELELLDSEAHRTLRVRRDAVETPHFVQVVASEFAAAATRSPLLLTKNPETGQFYVGALYGFKAGENLLVGGDEPPAYRPLDLERQGFFVAGENIAIDRTNPRFDGLDGETLFETDGSPGDPLRRVQRVLGRLKQGIEETDAFIAALARHRLIEPIDISLRFDDGETLTLQGLYTVSLDGLGDLADVDVLALFRSGHLQLAYCMIESLKQVAALASRRNHRLLRSTE